MKKKDLRILADILMFLAVFFLAGTGLLIHYRLVPGYRGGHGLTLLGLDRHEWGTYHLCAAYLLMFLVVVHLIFNFTFIKNVIAAKRPWIIIVLALIGLLVALFFLLMPIQRTGDGTKEHGRRFRARQTNRQLNTDAPDRPHEFQSQPGER